MAVSGFPEEHLLFKLSNAELASHGPTLAKMQQAFGYIQQCVTGLWPPNVADVSQADVSGPSGVIHTSMRLHWIEDEQTTVLIFLVHGANPAQLRDSQPELVPIPWLQDYAPRATAYRPFVEAFALLSNAAQGRLMLKEKMLQASGDKVPMRVVCAGHCIGGSLAALAAPYCALAFPTADVRCMTFGAPRVGNNHLSRLVHWLSEYSYHCTTAKDPVGALMLPPGGAGSLHGGMADLKYCIHLGSRDFANQTIRRHMVRVKKVPCPVIDAEGLAAHSLAAYASALTAADLRPPSVREHPVEKGLNALRVDRLFSAAPGVKDGTATCTRDMWATATQPGSAGERLQQQQKHEEDKDKERDSSDNAVNLSSTTNTSSNYNSYMGEVELPQESEQDAELREAEAVNLAALEPQLKTKGSDVNVINGKELELDTSEEPLSQQACESACMQRLKEKTQKRLQVDGGQQQQQGAAVVVAVGRFAGEGVGGSTEADSSNDSGFGRPSTASCYGALPELDEEQEEEEGEWSTDWDASLGEFENMSIISNLEEGASSSADESSAATRLGMLVLRAKVWQAMYASKAAYYQDPAKFGRCCGIPPENARLVADRALDANLWIAWHEGTQTLVITARGTMSLTGIVQDLKFLSRQMDFIPYFPGARTHMGILDQVLALTAVGTPSRVQAAIDQVVPPGVMPPRLLVTGHSLGAGVAQLMAMWSSLQFPLADVRCITFGAPRLGNRHYREAFALLCGGSIRVVNRNDCLVNLPPSFTANHYVHVDNMLWINKKCVAFGGRPKIVEAQPNNFHHYLYAYLHALKLLMPCPHGLTDFGEEVPDEDPEQFAMKVREAMRATKAEMKKAGEAAAAHRENRTVIKAVSKTVVQAVHLPVQAAQGVRGFVSSLARSVANLGVDNGGGLSIAESGAGRGSGFAQSPPPPSLHGGDTPFDSSRLLEGTGAGSSTRGSSSSSSSSAVVATDVVVAAQGGTSRAVAPDRN